MDEGCWVRVRPCDASGERRAADRGRPQAIRDGLAGGAGVIRISRTYRWGLVRRLNRIEYLNSLRDLFQIREIRLPVTFPERQCGPALRHDGGRNVSHAGAFGRLPGGRDRRRESARAPARLAACRVEVIPCQCWSGPGAHEVLDERGEMRAACTSRASISRAGRAPYGTRRSQRPPRVCTGSG